MRPFAAAAFLILAPALPLAAQISESMTVEVVEVPVYVSRANKPVRGLTREDFTLTVNGRPQPIDYFDVIDRRATSGEVGAAAAPQLNRRRMTMLLFDVSHSAPWTIRRAQAAATKFVQSARPVDAYSVATLTPRGVTLLVPFTTDHVNVQRAIASLSASRAGDAFGIATTREERVNWASDPMFDPARERFGARVDVPNDMSGVFLQARLENQWRQYQFRSYVDGLGELADVLHPIEGQKSVVLMTQGVQFENDREDAFSWASLMRMHKRFRVAGVILNAVDLNGLPGPFDIQSDPMLFNLALDTGGYVQHDRNDLLAALRDLDEIESVAYVLGFRPPQQQKATNSIRVKVRGAGLLTDVRYRRAYSAARPAGEAMNSVVLADVILNDIPQNGVSLGANVETADDTAAIVVSVPGREVLAYVGDDSATADAFIYVFDKDNAVAGWGQKKISIRANTARGYLEKNALRFAEVLKLEPGHYVAKVLFRVRGTDATGFTRTEFDVGG